jgi:hypothetical protein
MGLTTSAPARLSSRTVAWTSSTSKIGTGPVACATNSSWYQCPGPAGEFEHPHCGPTMTDVAGSLASIGGPQGLAELHTHLAGS